MDQHSQGPQNDSAISVTADPAHPGPVPNSDHDERPSNGEKASPDSVSLPPISTLLATLPDGPSVEIPSVESGPDSDSNMTRTAVRSSRGPTLLDPPEPRTILTSVSPSPSISTLSTGPISSVHSSQLRGSISPPYVFSGASRNSTPSSFRPTPDADDGYDDEDEQMRQQEALTQAEEGSVVVDRDEIGADAGYESDNNTSASTSLAESMRDYIFENGRRYHRFREGRYNFPNDDVEQQREDMKHAMVKMLCGNDLFFAPIGPNPQTILDMGTGTGVWAIEMGDLFESANVLGVDLSPIQPEWVPPNVRFMVDDIESPWLHPRNYFDYIHSRHTVMAIKDWPKLMRRSLEHLRPGGWFEMQEVFHHPISINNTMGPDHPVSQYWSLINEGLTALGVQFHAVANERMKMMMQECGYINVQEKVLTIPIGTWPKNKILKTVGLYWRTILLDGIQAIALGPLTRGCGWTREQVELFLVEVRRAYHDNNALMYMPFHVIYGQKPYVSKGC
ncbi:hypothetical protein OQA88_12060 [Cercophora sp. LCS_1]